MAPVPLDIVAEVVGLDPATRPSHRGARPGGRGDARRGRVPPCTCGPSDPPACPEAVEAVAGGRLGRLRARVVVHQRAAAPAGARAGRGAAPRPARAGSSRSTSRRRRGRPTASRPETAPRGARRARARACTIDVVLADAGRWSRTRDGLDGGSCSRSGGTAACSAPPVARRRDVRGTIPERAGARAYARCMGLMEEDSAWR